MYVTTNLGRLFYTESGSDRSGEGRAIILLHGYLFDGRLFRFQRAPLTELGRTVIFDLPGHGKSDVPPYFNLDENADAMRDALMTIGVRRAVVIGLSWGAMLAMRLALRHPELLSGIALLNTTSTVESWKMRARGRYFVESLRRGWFTMDDYRSLVVPGIFSRAFQSEHPAMCEEQGRNILGFSREGVFRAGLAVLIKRTSLHDRIPAIRTKTLVIGGTLDRLTPHALSENIAQAIPGAELVSLDCGHMSTLEKPNEVNAALVSFARNALTR